MLVYVVTMIQKKTKKGCSYTLGVFKTKQGAKDCIDLELKCRGYEYDPKIIGYLVKE